MGRKYEMNLVSDGLVGRQLGVFRPRGERGMEMKKILAAVLALWLGLCPASAYAGIGAPL